MLSIRKSTIKFNPFQKYRTLHIVICCSKSLEKESSLALQSIDITFDHLNITRNLVAKFHGMVAGFVIIARDAVVKYIALHLG